MNNKLELVKNENINYLLEKSKYKILNFKSDIIKLYNLIFDYCSKNKLLISNININISNNNYKLYDLDNDFIFNLYALDPYITGLSISNLIYNNYSKYVVMSSYLRNKDIIISIDNNKTIRIQLLFIPLVINEGNELLNKIGYNSYKLNKNIYFNINNNYKENVEFNIKYSDELLELLILSHKLYHPTHFLKYYKNISDSNLHKLEKILLSKNKINQNKINRNIIVKKNDELKNIRYNIINKISNSNDIKIILLDIYGIDIIEKILTNNNINIEYNNVNYNNIIHLIINSNYIELIKKIISNIIDENKFNLIIKTNNLYIINDFRLKRIEYQLINKKTNDKYILMYVYNSLDYEVIPTINKIKNIYIPHIFVLIRFLILNIYFNKLFNKNYNKYIYDNFILNIARLFNQLERYNNNINNNVKYLGTFIDDKIDKFKLGSIIYRPWQYYKKNKTLLKN